MAVSSPPDFDIYRAGLCFASVCSSLPLNEVKARMAAEFTGVGPWLLSDDAEFANGQPNPCPCENAPETHTHYLFSC